MKFTLKGIAHRVQVTVYDWSGTKWDNEPIKFTVRVLPRTAHPSTAFSKGSQEYHGASYAAAMGTVFRYYAGPIPGELKSYATKGA